MSRPANITPPKWPLKFLRWFCDPYLLEDIEGDLLELFQVRQTENNNKARWLFTLDILLLFRPGIIKNFSFNNNQTHIIMFFNHIKTAVRHALKYKGYTSINLLGLIVGLVSSILILLWIKDEVSVDKFHVNSDRTYQVWRNMHQASGEIVTTPGIPQPLQLTLENEYAEIEHVALYSWENELLFRLDESSSYESGRYASENFFDVFTFPFIIGNPQSALKDIYSVVISESMAIKYFGNTWKSTALGQAFKVDERQEFIVTGVFENTPPNSSMKFDWVIPAREYIQRNEWVESWYNGGFRIYFTLAQGSEFVAVQERMEQEINKNTNYEADERIYLQKFSDNYLYSTFADGKPVGGRIQYVKIMLVIAVFILIIACINFMNLATARSSRRTREIGLRKILGAHQQSLRFQFYIESFLYTIVSVLLALVIVYLIIPYFNNITGKSLVLNFTDKNVLIGLGSITVITGLLSGSYPALLLPSFKVINSLKGVIKHSKSGKFFRNGLVVFQFALSILMIIGTIIVSQQMDFILNKNLGLDKENLIYMTMQSDLSSKSEIFRNQLHDIPEVKNVTFTSGNPLSYGRSTSGASWEGKDPDAVVEINVLTVGDDFFETMKMKILDGREFNKELASDSSGYIINEVAADIMGFKDSVGKKLSVWGTDGHVIGVVNNFHMDSMYEPLEPVIIRYDPDGTFVTFIRTQNDTQTALKQIEKVTKAISPAYPFRYKFLDQEYQQTYKGEMTINTLVNIFAMVSIFISCLGLLGLSSYSTDQRSKEIGIRKVHGANVLQLVLILSKDYTRLMILAFILAAPVAYFYTQQWLDNFVFRIDLNLLVFLLAGMAAFIIGALTVSLKSYQASVVNPVKTLKDD